MLRGVDRATVAVAGAWLVLVLLGVGFRAAEAYGRPVGALGAAELRTFAFTLTAGRGLLLTAGCAATVLVCAALRTRDPDRVPQRVVLVAALLGALTPAVTGHAGTSADHQLAVVTVALHVAAAALWVGGLGAVARGGRAPAPPARRRAPPLLDAGGRLPRVRGRERGAERRAAGLVARRRWSPPATAGSSSRSRCASSRSAGLGWLARRRLAARRLPVLRWAGIEVALMAVTIGLAAALTQTA